MLKRRNCDVEIFFIQIKSTSRFQSRFSLKTWFFLSFLFIILAQKHVEGQNEHLTISSPNASAYARYGEIPVDIFTGQTNVQIPLWEILIGDISVPITLSYHTSGIKVQDRASSVGLGWSLNYGGGINCQVNHKPDIPNGFGNHQIDGGRVLEIVNNYLPIYRFPFILNNYLWALDLTEKQRSLLWESTNEAVYNDLASDVYNYRLPTASGKFFFNNFGKLINMNKANNITIQQSFGGSNNQHNMFTIRDQKGNKYLFKSYEKAISDGGISFPYYSSQFTYWLLDSIIDLNNNKLVYNYKDYNSQSWELHSVVNNGVNSGETENWLFCNYYNKVVSSISTTNQNIIFYSSNDRVDVSNEFKYDSIVVYNGTKPIRKINFFYGYFEGMQSNVWFPDSTSHLRLRLDSLSVDNNIYRFIYDTIQLPSRYSKNIDAWGYYNGASNSSLIPSYFSLTNTHCYVGANRKPNAKYLQAGILKEVNYPTGGKTLFEYEPNQVYAPLFDETPYLINYINSHDTTASMAININNCIEIPFSVKLGETSFNFFTLMFPDTLNWKQEVEMEIRRANNIKICNLVPRDSILLNLTPGEYKIVLNGLVSYSSYIQIFRKWKSPEYELSATNDPLVNKIYGGVRIKKISNFTEENKLSNFKSYHYTKPDSEITSSGMVNNFPKFSKLGQRIFRIYPSPSCLIYESNEIPLELNIRLFSTSVLPIDFNTNSYIGYSCVKTIFSDSLGNGMIIQEFTNIDTHPDIKYAQDYDYNLSPTTSLFWNRGLLKKEKKLGIINNNYSLVEETSYFYSMKNYLTDINNSSIGIAVGDKTLDLKAIDNSLNFCDCVNEPNVNCWYHVFFRPYLITSGYYQLDSTIKIISNIRHKEAFTYYDEYSDTIRLLKSHSIFSSSNTELKTSYSYAADYKGVKDDEFGISKLINCNLYASPIEERKEFFATGQSSKLIHAMFKSYHDNNCQLKTIYEIIGSNLVTDFTPAYLINNVIKIDPNYEPKMAFSSYNNRNNPTQIIFNSESNVSLSYGYNGIYQISKSTNATLPETGHTSFENNELNGWIKYEDNDFVTDPENVFTGKGAMSVTGNGPFQIFTVGQNAEKHSGYKASVWAKGEGAYLHIEVNGEWSSHVKVKNEINDGLWHKLEVELPRHKIQPYFSQGHNLKIKVYVGTERGTVYFDDLRFHPSDAQMTTYTHEPLIGVTSISNESNKPEFYIYDSFGRLEYIKDFEGNIIKKNDYHYRTNGQ